METKKQNIQTIETKRSKDEPDIELDINQSLQFNLNQLPLKGNHTRGWTRSRVIEFPSKVTANAKIKPWNAARGFGYVGPKTHRTEQVSPRYHNFSDKMYTKIKDLAEKDNKYNVVLQRKDYAVDEEHPGGTVEQTNVALDRKRVMRAAYEDEGQRKQII